MVTAAAKRIGQRLQTRGHDEALLGQAQDPVGEVARDWYSPRRVCPPWPPERQGQYLRYRYKDGKLVEAKNKNGVPSPSTPPDFRFEMVPETKA
jgi:hypothetical protein